jgi:choline dehydrogenase
VVEHGQTRIIHAGEVILCGGAINSPQLLQLSGVGNAAELTPLGIDVVHDLPAVGENMQDHLEVYVQYASKQPVSVAPAMKIKNRPSQGGARVAAVPAWTRGHQPLRVRGLRAQQR